MGAPRRAAVVAKNFCHAQPSEPAPRQSLKVGVKLAGAARAKQRMRAWVVGGERLMNFRPDLKGILTNTRAQPDQQLPGRNLAQCNPRGLDDAATTPSSQATPARMRASHDTALLICEQQGQAVGHHDRAGHAAQTGNAGVRLSTRLSVLRQVQHLIAMHLVHPHQTSWHDGFEPGAIAGDGLCLVAHAAAKVHAVKGRLGATALARGHQGAHMGWGIPLGPQPLGGHTAGVEGSMPQARLWLQGSKSGQAEGCAC